MVLQGRRVLPDRGADGSWPAAEVTEVARRRQIRPRQVFAWRREMRVGAPARLDFAPIVPALTPPTPEPTAMVACSLPAIALKLAGAVPRTAPGIDAAMVTMLLREIRASAA